MSKKVYFSQDGGVDDIISLFLLLQMDDVDLIGAGVGAVYFQPSEHRSHIHVDGCFLCRHRHRTHLGVVVFALDAILVFSEWLEA